MTLSKKDKDEFERIIEKAKRSELDALLGLVEKEIRLSETCIREGVEKRR